MILPAYLPGDFWTWDVAVRYESPTEGVLTDERERWTVRVGKDRAATAERRFLGTWVDGTLIPSTDPTPETLKGTVAPDGTLTFKGDWSDPASARAFRRLLRPDKALRDRLPGWPTVRSAILGEPDAKLPGSGLPASLRVEATLREARLGGKGVDLSRRTLPLGGG